MNTDTVVSTTAPNLQDTEALTHTIVDAVARADGVSSLDLQPLAQALDPDALGAVFRGAGRGGSVEFRYHGYRVRVSGDGDVVVKDLSD